MRQRLLLAICTKYIGTILLCFLVSQGIAQNLNNRCLNAEIIHLSNTWCSDTLSIWPESVSLHNQATCFQSTGSDYWFSFTSKGNALFIELSSVDINGLSLALFEGQCSQLEELDCTNSVASNGKLRLTWATNNDRVYFVQIRSHVSKKADFRLCIDDYYHVPANSQDCPTSFNLCNKESLVVNHISGSGDIKELVGESCFSTQPPFSPEINSMWFKWTCAEPGQLTFVLEPLLQNDDLDFVVYKFNGLSENCLLEPVRCMAAGVIPANCTSLSQCCGSTGLAEDETDVMEPFGCNPTSNNFLKALDMQSGESYALVVNNYSSENEGFKLSFGGDATFVGDAVDLILDPDTTVCINQNILVNSYQHVINPGQSIVSWYTSADGLLNINANDTIGTVAFGLPGLKYVKTEITDPSGCRVSVQKNVEVGCCGYNSFANIGENLTVKYGENVKLNVEVNLPGHEHIYQWTPEQSILCPDCRTTQSYPLSESMWAYVSVMDQYGCQVEDSVLITVDSSFKVFVPNAFTPNDDGINDRLELFSDLTESFSTNFKVYNRWGSLIYEESTNNQHIKGWDGRFKGRMLDAGVYVYVYEIVNGLGKKMTGRGSVSLLR